MIDSSKTQKFKRIIIESSDIKDTSIMTDSNYNFGYYERSNSRTKKSGKSFSRAKSNRR